MIYHSAGDNVVQLSNEPPKIFRRDTSQPIHNSRIFVLVPSLSVNYER